MPRWLARMAFEFDWSITLIRWLVTSLFVWLAARIVIDRSSIIAALLTALVANLLAALVDALVDGVLGVILAAVVWALVAALFFRTSWLKGAVIGLVAWVLWLLTKWVLEQL